MKRGLAILFICICFLSAYSKPILSITDSINTPERAKTVLDFWVKLGGKKERFDAMPASDWQILFEKAVAHSSGKTKTDAEVILAVLYHAQTNFVKARPLLEGLASTEEKLSIEQISSVLIRLEEEYRSAGFMDHAVRIRNRRLEKGFIRTFWELYKDCGLYDEAILDFKRFEPRPEQPGPAFIKYYLNLAYLFFENKQVDSSLTILQRALSIAKSLSPGPAPDYFDSVSLRYYTGTITGSIGRCLMQNGRYQEAIPKLLFDIAGSKGSPDNIHLKSLLLAECYLALNNPNNAFAQLIFVRNNLEGRADIASYRLLYPLLTRYYEKIGYIDSAFLYTRMDQKLSDSINGKVLQNQSLFLLTRMEIEKRRNDLIKANAALVQSNNKASFRNLILVILGVVITLLLIILYQLFRYNREMGKSQLAIAGQNLLLEEKNQEIERQNEYQNVLLRELHHRVKNNLQVLSSIISMQKRRSTDEHTAEVLSVLRSRIMAMSFVHESLHQNKEQLSSAARPFLEKFIQHLHSLNVSSKAAQLQLNIDDDLELSTDKMISVSLIINEVITNSFKYAKADPLAIQVEVIRQDESILLTIRDNGEQEPEKGFMDKGMGMKIILAMCSKLQGSYTVTYDKGLSHHIEFKP